MDNQSNKTVVESNKTQIESNNQTVVEGANAILDSVVLNSFHDYSIVKQLPTSGAEADIYIIEKDNNQYILKLYRHKLKPSDDLINKLLSISQKYPEDVVKIYDIAYDESLQRWYEIQEFAKYGSLREAIKKDRNFLLSNLETIVKEMQSLLKAIHNEHIIHRDIKPENILIRSKYPLDLIVTDFGVSSILGTGFSIKITSTSGTRIYFSPESFSGIIGEKVDYWALGMILLEIIEGDNIFGGEKDEAKIMYQITVLGIKIPDNIDIRFQNLLKGLLTKNPKKRWGDKEIDRWLKGEDNIPIYYEEVEGAISRGYKFKGQEFDNIKDLLLFMYQEENYKDAKEHIMRGYVTKWLEQNNFFDEALKLDSLKKEDTNIDVNLFLIFNEFVEPKDFIFMGKKITLENLLIYTNNTIKNTSSEIEATIVNYAMQGVLLRAYMKFTLERESDLYFILDRALYVKSQEELLALLQIVKEKKLAYKVIKDDDKYRFEEQGNLQKLYAILDGDRYILPKEQKELLDRGEYKKFKLLDYYISKKDAEEFMHNKDMFGLDNVSLKLIEENKITYNQVAKIVARSANMDSFEEFAKIYKEFSRIKGSKYISDNRLKDELQMKIIDSVQPLSKDDVKDIKSKIGRLKDNILKVKEYRKWEEEEERKRKRKEFWAKVKKYWYPTGSVIFFIIVFFVMWIGEHHGSLWGFFVGLFFGLVYAIFWPLLLLVGIGSTIFK